jgi:hypothetical protein
MKEDLITTKQMQPMWTKIRHWGPGETSSAKNSEFVADEKHLPLHQGPNNYKGLATYHMGASSQLQPVEHSSPLPLTCDSGLEPRAPVADCWFARTIEAAWY